MQYKRQRQAKVIRIFRKIHRYMGACLFLLFFVISISGGILGWKKNSNELILPKNYLGTSTILKEWIPVSDLYIIANNTLKDSISTSISLELNRIDIRKEKGIVKFIYVDHFYEVQLDGATGEILNLGTRNADLIENIHDGSILDNYIGTNGIIKLLYSSIMAIALLFFTITGFWLWYGPKRMRKSSITK
jgi:uncharacterized iron-regulated membrane protein